MGERGAVDEGAEDEEDEEIEGATVNVVLFDDVSGLSDLIWLFLKDETNPLFSFPVEMLFILFTLWSSNW